MLKWMVFALASVLVSASPAMAGYVEGKAAYVSQDWERALQELKPLADKGDDRAMLLVARMYILGKAVPRSNKEALALYKRAIVEKNNAEAMAMVGQMCPTGKQALPWFKRAADMGDGTGAFFYASYLAHGAKDAEGVVPLDLYAAYVWYKRAAIAPAERSRFRGYSENQALLLAKYKLNAATVARADKEAAAWKSASVESLGPLPPFPEVSDKPSEAVQKKPAEKKKS